MNGWTGDVADQTTKYKMKNNERHSWNRFLVQKSVMTRGFPFFFNSVLIVAFYVLFSFLFGFRLRWSSRCRVYLPFVVLVIYSRFLL